MRFGPNDIFDPTIVAEFNDLLALTERTGSRELYVDIARTDDYDEDGTPDRPYKDLIAALAIANANATVTTPYAVNVAPGIYSDLPSFQIANYVNVIGHGWLETVFKQVVPTVPAVADHFITMMPGSTLRGVSIHGPSTTFKAAIHCGTTGPNVVLIDEVTISRGYYGILCDQAGPGYSPVLIQSAAFGYAGSTIHTFFRVEGVVETFVVNALMAGPTNSITNGIEVSGMGAVGSVISYYHNVSGTTTGACVDNNALLRINSGIFVCGQTALEVGSTGTSRLRTNGTIIHRTVGGGYTNDILVNSATASVTFMGFMSRDRISNVYNAELYGNFINHETGYEGACALGELIVGTDKSVLPLIDYSKSAYLTGLASGGEVEIVSGLNIKVKAGYGYINDDASPTPVRVEWIEDPHFAMSNGLTEYIYVVAGGVITKSTIEPDYNKTIVLGQTVSYGGNVVLLTQDEISISHTTSRLAEFFEDIIGPLTASGCAITASAGVDDYKFNVGAGTFMVGLSEREIEGATATPFIYVWQSAPNVWVYTNATVIDPAHYDNGTGPTDFVTDDWKKDVVYLVTNQGGENYYVVLGQTPFVDQTAAQAGALPTVPEILDRYGLRVASIITHATASDIVEIIDERPFLGKNAPVTATVPTAHNDLSARDRDDNHNQYLTSGRANTWHALLAGAHVTNGDSHDHDGGDGGQVDHDHLANNGGTSAHTTISNHMASTSNPHAVTAAQVSAVATSETTATPTANKIPIANASAKLDGWVSSGSAAATPALRAIGTGSLEACAGDDSRLSNNRTPTAHAASHATGSDVIATAVAGVSPGLMSAADKTKLDGITPTATPTASRIPIADGSAKLDGWVSSGSAAATPALRAIGTGALEACAGNDSRLSNNRAPTAHAASHTTGADVISAAVAGVSSGLMSAADKTKLDGVASGATANIFGNNYQTSIDVARTTTPANTNFVNKVTLTTGTLTGTYRVAWTAVVDNGATNQSMEVQLYNNTDASIIGVVQVFRPTHTGERQQVGGFAEVTFAGAAKTFILQFRTLNAGTTAGCADGRVEIWRVA